MRWTTPRRRSWCPEQQAVSLRNARVLSVRRLCKLLAGCHGNPARPNCEQAVQHVNGATRACSIRHSNACCRPSDGRACHVGSAPLPSSAARLCRCSRSALDPKLRGSMRTTSMIVAMAAALAIGEPDCCRKRDQCTGRALAVTLSGRDWSFVAFGARKPRGEASHLRPAPPPSLAAAPRLRSL